jgi:hypothetical protein
MQELLVFAQGADVKINGIKGDNTYSVSQAVNVRYSEIASVNFRNDPNVIVSRNLNGIVASLRDVPKGKYSLDIAGETTVEIYYKPVVNIGIKLFKGRREIKTQEIEEGNYQIQYGIVNEAGEFFESTLLGKVDYEATAQNGGRTIQIKSSDPISLQQGELVVDVSSHFLEINTAENSITHRILTPLPFKEKFRNWLWKYRFIIGPLLLLLLLLLLYWILWGRKVRFPKFMKEGRLEITVKRDSGGDVRKQDGSFKKNSVWKPFCAEQGVIRAVASGGSLPSLKVKALKSDMMELMNTSDFTGKINFSINDIPIQASAKGNKTMPCKARITSVHNVRNTRETHIFTFNNPKNQRKGKK